MRRIWRWFRLMLRASGVVSRWRHCSHRTRRPHTCTCTQRPWLTMTASPRAHALGLLVAGVALIDVGAQYQRRYQAGKRTSHLVLSCSLLAVGQVAEFVAVSLLPLTLSAVAVSGMAAIVQCTARARDPVAQLQKQWWLLLTVFTGFLIIAASVDGSDRMTPDEMKQQLSSKSALLFLLLNVIVMLGLLFWISETNYAFQVEPQPTDPTGYTCRAQFHVRQLFRQTLLSPFAIQEMNIRSKTFGVLAGLAGATALLFEKCAGEMVRYAVRSPPSVTSNAITMVALAMAVWSIFAAFQAKWVSIGLNETLTPSIVYKPYLFMLSLVATCDGYVFFGASHHIYWLASTIGLAVFVASILSFDYDAECCLFPGEAALVEDLLPPTKPSIEDEIIQGTAHESTYRPPAFMTTI